MSINHNAEAIREALRWIRSTAENDIRIREGGKSDGTSAFTSLKIAKDFFGIADGALRLLETHHSDISVEVSVNKLVSFLTMLPDFKLVTEIDGSYGHMGATLTDAILQSGIDYKSVVKPRVNNIKTQYPSASTTSGFLKTMSEHGLDRMINFKGAKVERIKQVAEFLQSEQIETEDEFAVWLSDDQNVIRIKKLKGIKDKTADYMKILVGQQGNAVDRHLIHFLEQSGVPFESYQKTSEIINRAADHIGVNRSLFDHSIWKYMSERS
ncbi:hypothetical protein [Brevibacillus choshinensis]|uniref:Uncharacterized protein n=1 Tax=Brevibacillus choshinensis TaxID=54911 RepID=A0ABX7FIL4_BRECH|nr:hypothetical protein [Brevibacillus choshinensis]QRG65166.1 hypothetical protein JNE38_16080 [Brevibacillus choshinensis]